MASEPGIPEFAPAAENLARMRERSAAAIRDAKAAREKSRALLARLRAERRVRHIPSLDSQKTFKWSSVAAFRRLNRAEADD